MPGLAHWTQLRSPRSHTGGTAPFSLHSASVGLATAPSVSGPDRRLHYLFRRSERHAERVRFEGRDGSDRRGLAPTAAWRATRRLGSGPRETGSEMNAQDGCSTARETPCVQLKAQPRVRCQARRTSLSISLERIKWKEKSAASVQTNSALDLSMLRYWLKRPTYDSRCRTGISTKLIHRAHSYV